MCPTNYCNLTFVDENPTAISGDNEKSRVIRSHVSQWSWRNVRYLPATRDEPLYTRVNSDDNNDNDGRNSRRINSQSNDSWLSTEYYPDHDIPNFDRITATQQENNHVSDLESYSMSKNAILNDPTSTCMLRQSTHPFSSTINEECFFKLQDNGLLDPFQTHVEVPLRSSDLNNCNAYCISIIWPGLMPKSSQSMHNDLAYGWFSLTRGNAMLLMAMSFASLTHKMVRCLENKDSSFENADRRMMDLCEIETVEMINSNLADPSRAISDAMILSVFALATNRAEESLFSEDIVSPFQAPLRKLQWLDIYGALLANPMHQAGLAQLVALRGGLEGIELPGLGAVISYADLIEASRACSSPFFPLITSRAKKNVTLLAMFDIDEDEMRVFADCHDLGYPTDLIEVFHAMRAYSVVAGAYESGSLANPNLDVIADQRNFTQHRILSLPGGSQLEVTSREQMLYESCRIAAMIYGVGVIFPLPTQTTPLKKLARSLKQELQKNGLLNSRLSSTGCRFLMWSLVLGGMASLDTPERLWFISELKTKLSHQQLSTFTSLRRLLKSVLWLDCACDKGVQDLWNACINLENPQKTP